jgi:hypothetical protein
MPTAFTKSPGDVKAIRTAIINYLKDLAVKKGIVANREDAVVRDIQPDVDLGFSSANWSESVTANTWNTIYNAQVPAKKLFAFYGVENIASSPLSTAVIFKVGAGGAKVKDIEEIEPMYAKAYKKEAIFTNPILYENNQYMVIQVFAKGTGTDNLILLGLVCEPKGETISPD